MEIKQTRRQGGRLRYDIMHEGQLIEGGFFSRGAAEVQMRYHQARVGGLTKVNIAERQLSDGSTVWDVYTRADGKLITFGCQDEPQARELAELLEVVSWIEVD